MIIGLFRKAMPAPFLLAGAAAALSGCIAPPLPETSLEAASLVVTGSATYRERMAAPKGSVLKVELSDTSRADAPAISLADWSDSLDDGGVPKRFTLRVNDTLDPRMTYTLRATVKGPDGTLLWTTDTAYRLDAVSGNVNAGELVMVKVAKPAAKAPPLAATSWLVETMGAAAIISGHEPQISFSGDGRISGTTGCNQFFGTYTQTGSRVAFSGVGMTKMACLDDGIMAQEIAFGAILSGEAEASIDAHGNLTIRGEKGVAFTARPLAAEQPDGDPAVLTGAAWRVEDLNRGGIIDNSNLTLTFGEDGTVTGSTHCNSLSGGYTATATTITFTPIRTTLRACLSDSLGEQEARFVEALRGDMQWRETPDGAIELTREFGHRILLRR